MMPRLTHERCSGIKTGYWSAASKETVTQKLGAIEAKAPKLLADVCEHACLWHAVNPSMDARCKNCPVNALVALIDV